MQEAIAFKRVSKLDSLQAFIFFLDVLRCQDAKTDQCGPFLVARLHAGQEGRGWVQPWLLGCGTQPLPLFVLFSVQSGFRPLPAVATIIASPR